MQQPPSAWTDNEKVHVVMNVSQKDFERESEAGSESKRSTTSSSGQSAKKRKRSPSESETSSTLQERWDEMFERLKAYKEANGNCNVPNRYAKDPQLGFWVSTQRRQYRVLTSGGSTSSALTVQRAQKLINLGFEWSAKDPRMVPWESRFKQLEEFVTKHGHAQVPIGWEENVPLSNWVSKQRQEFKLLQKGKPSRLTQERIDSLNRVGFVWEAKRGAPRHVVVAGDLQPAVPSEGSSPPARASLPKAGTNGSPEDTRAVNEATEAKTPAAAQQVRGMGPVSPTDRGSGDSPPAIQALPTARLPPPPQAYTPTFYPPSSSRYRGPYYHGGYHPPPPMRHEYFTPPDVPSHYQPSFTFPGIHSVGPPPHYDSPPLHYDSPPLPQSHGGTPWSVPPTGRVLTPLYPMEPPSGATRYPLPLNPVSVATSPPDYRSGYSRQPPTTRNPMPSSSLRSDRGLYPHQAGGSGDQSEHSEASADGNGGHWPPGSGVRRQDANSGSAKEPPRPLDHRYDPSRGGYPPPPY